jgi:dTDP-4-amino-4,6-dideoxygalactose transaminase
LGGVADAPRQLPAAGARAAEELSLAMHPDLVPEQIERVVDAVQAAASAWSD